MKETQEIRTITLHGDALTHESLARALSFPAWYGKNLDALYDCLTALPPTVLFITDPGAKPENAPLLRVIYDAAARSRNFWIYIR